MNKALFKTLAVALVAVAIASRVKPIGDVVFNRNA